MAGSASSLFALVATKHLLNNRQRIKQLQLLQLILLLLLLVFVTLISSAASSSSSSSRQIPLLSLSKIRKTIIMASVSVTAVPPSDDVDGVVVEKTTLDTSRTSKTVLTERSSSSTLTEDDSNGDVGVVIDDNNNNPSNPDYVMTDEEKIGVTKMMESLTDEQKQSLADPYMTLRHYRAEKGDVTKAITAIQATLKWRKEFGVNEIINNNNHLSSTDDEMRSILKEEMLTGKMYVRGYDKDGRSCLYMRPSKENTHNEINNMRHLVFQLEKAIACNDNVRSKICLIIDYNGFRLRDAPPMSTSKHTLEILQQHYPERLHRAYICNPPWIFNTFWNLIKPFVDPVTKSKVCFCSGSKGMSKILNDMGGYEKASRHLEECAGGNKQLREYNPNEYFNLPMNVGFDE